MKVAVIDVGSNTVRMLVARTDGSTLEPVAERKARIGLGRDVESTGKVSAQKLDEAADHVAICAAAARRERCERLEVVVASPGRQAANAGRLVRRLAAAAGAPVRVLTREEEAWYAFEGALAANPDLRSVRSVAVCDVGGGSTQVAVGHQGFPAWARSFDIGSLRLATRTIHDDPPDKAQVAAARAAASDALEGFAPPLPVAAAAVGGSARALKKLVGPELGPDELQAALKLLRRQRVRDVAEEFGIEPGRVATLAAGAAILMEVQLRLAIPLRVVRGGLREGLVLSLAADAAAARAASS
jgi:exopolyphosphatase/guanosine-5'-triphosphate,3'-diphosphate pyrophosphatase